MTVQGVNIFRGYYRHSSFGQEVDVTYSDLILLVQGHTIILRHYGATVRLHLATVSSGCYSIFHENNGILKTRRKICQFP